MGLIEALTEEIKSLRRDYDELKALLITAINSSNNDQLFTVDETAEFLGISDNTVLKLVNSGKLPGKKFGRAWKFKKSDLLEFQKS